MRHGYWKKNRCFCWRNFQRSQPSLWRFLEGFVVSKKIKMWNISLKKAIATVAMNLAAGDCFSSKKSYPKYPILPLKKLACVIFEDPKNTTALRKLQLQTHPQTIWSVSNRSLILKEKSSIRPFDHLPRAFHSPETGPWNFIRTWWRLHSVFFGTFDPENGSYRHQKLEQVCLYFGCGPLTVTVTTKIITFLMGNPYKPSFTTVTVRGPHPIFTVGKTWQFDIYFLKLHAIMWVIQLSNYGWLYYHLVGSIVYYCRPLFSKSFRYQTCRYWAS